jgi:hypothetical protein
MVHRLLRRRNQSGRLSFRVAHRENWSGQIRQSLRRLAGTQSRSHALRKRQKDRREPTLLLADENRDRAQQKPESKSSGLFGNGQPAFISAPTLPQSLDSSVSSRRFSHFLKLCLASQNLTPSRVGSSQSTQKSPCHSCILSCFSIVLFRCRRPWFEVPS